MLRLKDLREDKGLLQKDIAKILNTTQTNYSKYELGKINIPNETLKQLALYYETSVDYILGLTNETKPYKRAKWFWDFYIALKGYNSIIEHITLEEEKEF